MWLNDRATGSFKLKQSGTLPRGAGPITFADMGKSSLSRSSSLNPLSLIPPPADRDGTLDLVFPTCDSFSTSTGIGRSCSINIAYNKQKPLCASTSPEKDCRSPEALCVADPDFKFNLESSPGDGVRTLFSYTYAGEETQRY